VALVSEHGLYGTARALHLDYGALKQHVVDAADRQQGDGVAAKFVELPRPPAPDACVIEVEGVRTAVRVRLNGLAVTELAEFTRLVVGAGA
jgi:hypothetical protein